MPSLYEINREYLVAIDQGFVIDEETGEILETEEMMKFLEELTNDKLDSYFCYIKNQEADIDALDNEIKALQERKQKKMKVVSRMREMAQKSMEMRDMERFETARNLVTFRKSTSVEIDDEMLAKKYKVAKWIPDKKVIKDLLKSGKSIKGATLVEKRNMSIK